jgi:hypothetical protein
MSGALPAFAARNGTGASATSTPAATTKTDYCAVYEQALAGARQAAVAQVAHTLHLTTSQLESDLSPGKTISQIASAQTVNISAVKAVYLSTVQAQLAYDLALRIIATSRLLLSAGKEPCNIV